MPTILLVEDDPQLGELVCDFLTGHGFSVRIEARGDEAVPSILEGSPDLVLLDLMLPGLDGMEVCRQVRKRGFEGPILMLTARGDSLDEILGLGVGADDYIAKPVRPQVLLARIQAVLRRLRPAENTLERGRLRLDLQSRTVTLEGEVVQMSTAEFDMLVVLARHAGTVLSRDDLSDALRGVPWDGIDRSFDLRISRLRKRLGDDGSWIKSVRGSGYLLVPEL